MHSVAVDGGSPRKRTISRGMSEDESLRSIIQESESSSRRLTRSDSRTGTLKKRADSQQSDQDFLMGPPEMLELQASYDEVVQELRGLEVEREALLFQVDVLQDTLEGVEELLAEAQREAGQASLALGQEQEARRKLESLVSSLMQEVERLKEEGNKKPPAAENVTDGRPVKPVSSEVTEAALNEKPHRGENHLEDKGSILMKLRRTVDQPAGQPPSLSLDDLGHADGVLRRPYENPTEDGRDLSPDRNDSDKSAYEDASAETPEQDRMFPDDGDLPHDSENMEGNPDTSETHDPKNPEACVLS